MSRFREVEYCRCEKCESNTEVYIVVDTMCKLDYTLCRTCIDDLNELEEQGEDYVNISNR